MPVPIRTPDGTIIGAISRATGGRRGWDPLIARANGTGYDPIGYGCQTVPTPTEADAMVRAEHAVLVRLGDR